MRVWNGAEARMSPTLLLEKDEGLVWCPNGAGSDGGGASTRSSVLGDLVRHEGL
jgi:hypothetical protein